jgi:gas vesicle protein GvpA/GvpJ/GvpM family
MAPLYLRGGAVVKKRTRQDEVRLVQEADPSLLELVDNVLTKGVVIDGDIVLGLANVDLVYLRVFALLCAADKIMGRQDG